MNEFTIIQHLMSHAALHYRMWRANIQIFEMARDQIWAHILYVSADFLSHMSCSWSQIELNWLKDNIWCTLPLTAQQDVHGWLSNNRLVMLAIGGAVSERTKDRGHVVMVLFQMSFLKLPCKAHWRCTCQIACIFFMPAVLASYTGFRQEHL